MFDYLWSGGRPTVLVSEPDDVRAQGEKLTQQIQASHDEAIAQGQPRAPAVRADRRLGRSRLVARRRDGARDACRSDEAGAHRAVSRRSSSPAASRTGRPRSGAAARPATRLSSSPTRPGRAERTIELLADYEIYAAPIERAEDVRTAAVLVGVGHLSRGFRLPEAGLQLWAETDVFEEERQDPRAAAARPPARSSPISAT